MTSLSIPPFYKRVIQLELNEVSRTVISDLIAQGQLPNFKRMEDRWQYVQTTSEARYEHIEPWIQWVSAHTGCTYEEHGIFRLGDADRLTVPQLWEILSKSGIESGIIGSMNTIRRDTEGGIFFPDPWSKTKDVYPASLSPLWGLISSKVQKHATSSLSKQDYVNGLKAMLKYRIPPVTMFKIGQQIIRQKIDPKQKWKLAILFDEFLFGLFKRVLHSTSFGYYTLFLNAVAHYQHHYWRNYDNQPFPQNIVYDDIHTDADPITYGYKIYDKILGKLLDYSEKHKNTLVIVATGLSQEPYTSCDHQGGMNYYRLKDHETFVKDIAPDSEFEVFPLMSRDWQIACKTRADELRASEIFGRLKVDGGALFQINSDTPGYLFFETAFTKGTDENTMIVDSQTGRRWKFEDYFCNIAIKSGHHLSQGSTWFSQPILAPDTRQIPLTDLFGITLSRLGVKLPQKSLQKSNFSFQKKIV